MNIGNVIRYLVGFIIVACLMFCLFLFSSCANKRQVVAHQREAHTEQRDSIQRLYVRDSIYIDRWHAVKTKNDTVFVYDSIYHFDGKQKSDTVRIETKLTDTIPSEPVVIEKPISNGTRFLRNSGIALWCIVALLVVAMVIGIVIKFAK